MSSLWCSTRLSALLQKNEFFFLANDMFSDSIHECILNRLRVPYSFLNVSIVSVQKSGDTYLVSQG